MTAHILGMDVVVWNIEIILDERDERVICLFVRRMGATIHHLQCVLPADVIGYLRRVMAHHQQLIAVTDFPQMRFHPVLP